MIGANAEASTSRRTLDSTNTRRSGRQRAASNANSASAPNSATRPAPAMSTNSGRKVRTVPPSAVFDPPTPPALEQQTTFDTVLSSQRQAQRQPPKRRRRMRYVSSDEDSSDDEYDDTDDDEPPWWTFTARGMSKLRAMGVHRGSVDPGGESAGESGREGRPGPPLDKQKNRKRSRSRERAARKTPERMDSGDSTNWTGNERRGSSNKLFNHRPFRLPTSPLNRRSTDLVVNGPVAQVMQSAGPATAPGMTRSNSEPGAPPTSIAAAVADAIERTDTPEQMATDYDTSAHDHPSPRRSSSVRRFLTTRHRSSVDGADNFTDSETAMVASPRLKAKQRLFAFGGVPEESGVIDLSDPSHDGLLNQSGYNLGDVTPSRSPGTPTPNPHNRMRRLNSNNLRIRLPPPISQHFANGWPHAGSWHDALRTGDVFEEHIKEKEGGLLHGPSSLHQDSLNTSQNGPAQTPGSIAPVSTPPSGIIKNRELDDGGNGTSTDTDGGSRPKGVRISAQDHGPGVGALGYNRSSSEAPRERRRMKRKQKRHKRYGRYRPAQVPPTPGGLGFTPSIRSEKTANSFQAPEQAADLENVNPFDRIDEEYMLSPQQSRLSEKGTSTGWGRFWIVRRLRYKHALDGLSVYERFRRMLFLDARITIYIRLFNLAITCTLLGLAVTIRRKLYQAGLPGIIGPSTTLIIAYAAFTIVHVLTAMYREYFGRPIGLWGLRSKMLWVCLDLLFVALWSSAMTLAVNDYIDTPLDCTPLAPWWTPGYDYYGSARKRDTTNLVDTPVPDGVKLSPLIVDVCNRQVALFSISLVALLLYCGNMVLSLFRIFETVRRTAGSRAIA